MNLPKITNVMLVLTHACNLCCRYCFVQQKPETMTYQIAKDTVHFLINNCKPNQVPGINFFGGEPMLCWDSIVVPLTKYIREELKVPFELGMTTNGTLLNEERIKFLKDNNINILLSIDGDKDTQDYNRPCINGQSSFDMLESILPSIVKNLHPTFRMTAIPETSKNIFHNIMFAEEQGFKDFFIIPNVYQQWSIEEWNQLEQEIHKYSDYFIDHYKNNKKPINFSTIEKFLQKINQINYAIDQQLYRENCESCNKCGLGANKFASIHPNGDIYGCQEITSNEGKDSIFYIGNIYTGVEEDRRLKLMSFFDKNQVQGLTCSDCQLNRICDGGCVASNYLITGNINIMPKLYCKWEQLLLQEVIYIMNNLFDNELFQQDWRNKYGRY